MRIRFKLAVLAWSLATLAAGAQPALAAKTKARPATKTPEQSDASDARIETVTGTGLTVAGKAAGSGAQLPYGAQVTTDASTSAMIQYSDQSQIFLGRSSSLVVAKPARPGTRLTRLERGELRARVAKASTDGKPHFLVQTHSLAMGVRGTEFDVSTDAKGERTELHTLEGKVEAGRDLGAIESGKGVMVSANQFVASMKGRLQPPKTFDRQKYFRQLQKSQPQMHELSQKGAQMRTDMQQGIQKGANQAADQARQQGNRAAEDARMQLPPGGNGPGGMGGPGGPGGPGGKGGPSGPSGPGAPGGMHAPATMPGGPGAPGSPGSGGAATGTGTPAMAPQPLAPKVPSNPFGH